MKRSEILGRLLGGAAGGGKIGSSDDTPFLRYTRIKLKKIRFRTLGAGEYREWYKMLESQVKGTPCLRMSVRGFHGRVLRMESSRSLYNSTSRLHDT